MSIIIGREQSTDTPRLSVQVNGTQLWYGQPGSVPKSVSRKHCSIDMNDDGTLSIANISDNNLMEINGKQVLRSGHVGCDSVIRLGKDKYELDLKAILTAASAKKEYSIGHLKQVYEDYMTENENLQIRQSQLQALATLPGVISPLSLLAAFVSSDNSIRVVMVALTVVLALATFIWRMHNSKSLPARKKAISDKFNRNYVCPNKVCGRELGAYKYTNLLNGGCCPYCKAKFKE